MSKARQGNRHLKSGGHLKVVVFALGFKGINVLKAAEAVGFLNCVYRVIVGTDRGVDNDYSSEVIAFCELNKISWGRESDSYFCTANATQLFAIAAGWRWMINQSFREIIVIHDSLLPRYRGFNPLVSALLAEEPIIGVTAFLANGGYDSGPIIATRKLSVDYPTKVAVVTGRIADLYFDIACDIFLSLGNGESFMGVPQDESKVTYSIWRDDEDYRIDWSKSAAEIRHFISCVGSPYRGASAIYDHSLLRIHNAEIEEDVEIVNRDVGKVIFVRETQPVVICGSGLLRLTHVKDEIGNSVLPFKRFRVRLK